MAMIYAPVTIPTLCRAEHFIRCVESLKKNPWARYTELYIGLDYPARESHREGYQRINEYLQGDFPEFKAVRVYRHKKNVGANRNCAMLREEVFKTYDRYIYLEDDLEASPNFLEYMDKALMEYENDPQVVAVAGYSYPLEWKAEEGTTVVKQNFNGTAWGRGFWRSKREEVVKYLSRNGLCKDFSEAYRSGRFRQMIDFAIKDYVTLCENGWSSKHSFLNTTTDIAMRIYLAVQNKYYIMPLVSKIRNHGYDGSGLYCQQIEGKAEEVLCVDNYSFSQQPIDEAESFCLVEDKQFDLEQNRNLLNQFDRTSPEDMAEIWKKAEVIARRGRYGGALLIGKKAVYKLKKKIARWK